MKKIHAHMFWLCMLCVCVCVWGGGGGGGGLHRCPLSIGTKQGMNEGKVPQLKPDYLTGSYGPVIPSGCALSC